MDISVTTILAAVLPVLATSMLFALFASAAVIFGMHTRPKNDKPRR